MLVHADLLYDSDGNRVLWTATEVMYGFYSLLITCVLRKLNI
jgi:hypothetical protein